MRKSPPTHLPSAWSAAEPPRRPSEKGGQATAFTQPDTLQAGVKAAEPGIDAPALGALELTERKLSKRRSPSAPSTSARSLPVSYWGRDALVAPDALEVMAKEPRI